MTTPGIAADVPIQKGGPLNPPICGDDSGRDYGVVQVKVASI
jgi:hypothetical protein